MSAQTNDEVDENTEEVRAALLGELRVLRGERDGLQSRLDAIDGRRWDVFQKLRQLTPTTPHRLIGEAYGVSEPAVIQTLRKPRPEPQVRS